MWIDPECRRCQSGLCLQSLSSFVRDGLDGDFPGHLSICGEDFLNQDTQQLKAGSSGEDSHEGNGHIGLRISNGPGLLESSPTNRGERVVPDSRGRGDRAVLGSDTSLLGLLQLNTTNMAA